MAMLRIWFGAMLVIALSCTSAVAMSQAQKQALLRKALQNAHATQSWMSYGFALVDAAGNLSPEAKSVVAKHVKADLAKILPEMLDSVSVDLAQEMNPADDNVLKMMLKISGTKTTANAIPGIRKGTSSFTIEAQDQAVWKKLNDLPEGNMEYSRFVVAAAGGRENIVNRIVKVVKDDVQKYSN